MNSLKSLTFHTNENKQLAFNVSNKGTTRHIVLIKKWDIKYWCNITLIQLPILTYVNTTYNFFIKINSYFTKQFFMIKISFISQLGVSSKIEIDSWNFWLKYSPGAPKQMGCKRKMTYNTLSNINYVKIMGIKGNLSQVMSKSMLLWQKNKMCKGWSNLRHQLQQYVMHITYK